MRTREGLHDELTDRLSCCGYLYETGQRENEFVSLSAATSVCELGLCATRSYLELETLTKRRGQQIASF